MYRKVDTRIWNDAKFCAMSDSGKLVFLMLLTHPRMTSLGAMKASVAGMAEEIGWDFKKFQKAFREPVGFGIVDHDPRACLVYLPNFIKYNKPESPNVMKAWVKSSALLPECEMRDLIMSKAYAFAESLPKAFQESFAKEALKSYPHPLVNQEQEQRTGTESLKAPSQAESEIGTTAMGWEIPDPDFSMEGEQ